KKIITSNVILKDNTYYLKIIEIDSLNDDDGDGDIIIDKSSISKKNDHSNIIKSKLFKIDVIFDQFGLSVIDDSHNELIYLYLLNTRVKYKEYNIKRMIEFKVGHLQVDSSCCHKNCPPMISSIHRSFDYYRRNNDNDNEYNDLYFYI